MKLYLVQHGVAVPKENDPERPLSEVGVEETIRVAHYAATIGLLIDRIWHSGKLRSLGTAEILAAAINPNVIMEEVTGLNPKDPVKPIAKRIKSEKCNLMLVAHLPLLEKLVGLLCAGDENLAPLKFTNSGIVCLEQQNNHWQIEWSLPPGIIKNATGN